ncbi:hypothetical protein [Mesorhizobium sp. YR577]|uniref:hypothetical protein n=1 Tax=Mesorhizobium sp. YR577 TaxID=1884373 RepID=UPI0008E8B623|nr:hypothetical protein [Mesorhizobium sp. YR577]SFT58186.1 hypothetical protein SAMN05518861_102329 [Mesorhizobium sp. YR577]
MVFQKMKRPQRDFVVEIKSSRRLAKSKPGSIWGSLDLKAHAADVEDLLRTDDGGAVVQGSIEVASASDKPDDLQNGSVVPSAIQQKDSGPENTEEPANDPKPNDHYGLRAVADDVKPTMISTAVERKGGASLAASETSSKKTIAKSRRRVGGVPQTAQKNKPVSESSPVRDDGLAGSSKAEKNVASRPTGKEARRDLAEDLVELEVENRHLKKLLADKLRKENAELKRKLGFS